MMISLVEYARRHNKSANTVRQKAASGGFRTAVKVSPQLWMIDETEPYEDLRRRKRTPEREERESK